MEPAAPAPAPSAPAPDPGVPATAFDQPAAPAAAASPAVISGPVPKSGNGLLGGGITMIVHGGLNALGSMLALVVVESVFVDEAVPSAVRGYLIGSAVLYTAEVGGGIAMTVLGTRRRRELRGWQMQNRVMVPKDGNGMIVVGSILTGLGALNLISTAAVYRSYGLDLPGTTMLGAGINVAVGAGLLTGGLVRRSRYRDWLMRNNLSMTPYAAPTRGGASFGITGRF